MVEPGVHLQLRRPVSDQEDAVQRIGKSERESFRVSYTRDYSFQGISRFVYAWSRWVPKCCTYVLPVYT